MSAYITRTSSRKVDDLVRARGLSRGCRSRVAAGVTANGDREVLGVDVGESEDEVFWTAFLRGLRTGVSAACAW